LKWVFLGFLSVFPEYEKWKRDKEQKELEKEQILVQHQYLHYKREIKNCSTNIWFFFQLGNS